MVLHKIFLGHESSVKINIYIWKHVNKIILLTYCPLNVLTYFGGNYMVTFQRGTYFFLKKRSW